MRTLVFEGVVTALTSVSHIGETRGVNSMLRREKIVGPDHQVEEIPIISGNSLRGLLRDRGMLHMCSALGYGVNVETGEVQGLSLPAFYFLFSGGSLTKDAGRGLDVDLARRMRRLIPLVGVFGGAMGNQIMPGKLKIGKLIPICEETRHLIPERFSNGQGSIWEMLQSEAYTRKDDEKSESLRMLIAPETRALLEAKAGEQRAKKAADPKAVDEDMGQHQQMRYFAETFAAGTQFYWDICLDDVDDVEFDAFAVCLAEFSKKPYIGGKSAIGHGKVGVRFDKWLSIDPRSKPEGTAVDVPLGAKYQEHLKTHSQEIRDELARMA